MAELVASGPLSLATKPGSFERIPKMAMTLTMTVKTRGHLVLDFAYFAAQRLQAPVPLRLATLDGTVVTDTQDEAPTRDRLLAPKSSV